MRVTLNSRVFYESGEPSPIHFKKKKVKSLPFRNLLVSLQWLCKAIRNEKNSIISNTIFSIYVGVFQDIRNVLFL